MAEYGSSSWKVTCPRCGRTFSAGKCSNCGSSNIKRDTYENSYLRCGNCGSHIIPSCPYCGTNSSSGVSSGESNLWANIKFFGGIAIAIYFIYLLFTSS